MSYMTSVGSPTLNPPMAYASKPIATVPAALSSRSSGNTPPWTIPNCACPAFVTATPATGPARSSSRRVLARPAHRSVRLIETRAAPHVGRMGQALVEHHRHVRAELRLDVRGLFRRQKVRGAVEVRLEARALLVNRAARRKAEHLVAAAVGENRPRPADEAVKSAVAGDQIVARPQIEVIRVAEEDLGAESLEIPMGQTFHGALRADRHECRRLDAAVRGRHDAGTGAPLGVRDAKTETRVRHRAALPVYNRPTIVKTVHAGAIVLLMTLAVATPASAALTEGPRLAAIDDLILAARFGQAEMRLMHGRESRAGPAGDVAGA